MDQGRIRPCKAYPTPGLSGGLADEQDELADDRRRCCYGRDGPDADFGTVECKIGREGSGRYGRGRPTETGSTGNTGYFRADSRCTRGSVTGDCRWRQ